MVEGREGVQGWCLGGRRWKGREGLQCRGLLMFFLLCHRSSFPWPPQAAKDVEDKVEGAKALENDADAVVAYVSLSWRRTAR